RLPQRIPTRGLWTRRIERSALGSSLRFRKRSFRAVQTWLISGETLVRAPHDDGLTRRCSQPLAAVRFQDFHDYNLFSRSHALSRRWWLILFSLDVSAMQDRKSTRLN